MRNTPTRRRFRATSVALLTLVATLAGAGDPTVLSVKKRITGMAALRLLRFARDDKRNPHALEC